MNYFLFVLGIVVGAGGYFLYDKYSGTLVSRIKKLEGKLAVLKGKM